MKKPRKLAGEELFHYALRLLGGRALSVSELRTKLINKASDRNDVEPAMARLREYGYLDDARFAEGYATARRDSGAAGKLRVLRDLRQRRVAPALAEKAVTDAFANTDEIALIQEWLRRKLRGKILSDYLQDEKQLASVYRKLRYAGFSSAASIRALKEFAVRADELEDEQEEPDTSEPERP